MKKTIAFFLFVAAIFALSSCATIFSRPHYVMSVFSDLPNSEVIINNEHRYGLPTNIAVTRSFENLGFTVVQNDSIVNDAILRPRLSNTFLWGNLYGSPIGYLVDLASDNRFTYGRYVFIDSLGNVSAYQTRSFNKMDKRHFKQHEEGSVNFLVAIPYLNFFNLNLQNKALFSEGFFGFGLGVEHFYRNNKSFQLRGDAVWNSALPFFPIPILTFQNLFYAFNLNLTDNFHSGRFQMGYGLNFARNIWVPPFEAEYYPPIEVISEQRNANNMLGLALSTHYRLTNGFHLGLIYRPSFIELSNFRPMYEHTISIDLLWKIHL